jgi:hypothetical protein
MATTIAVPGSMVAEDCGRSGLPGKFAVREAGSRTELDRRLELPAIDGETVEVERGGAVAAEAVNLEVREKGRSPTQRE